ncbi:MAG: efflux RND transporter permease subunit [Gammaproteobacteria bacterium]|nr:efflux RND transporter permease subunit [Gammaproteobacteria bacterium]
MSLVEHPIRRFQPTLVAFLCLVAMGIFAFLNVPREEDPYFKISAFFITVVMPGADPIDLERLVAKPLEDRLAELDDVKDIESTIRDNVAVVVVKFEAYTDPDKKYDEVQREINAIRPELPAEIARLEIRKFSPALVNTVQFALVSPTATYRELEDLARDFRDRLKRVDGVRTAESWAFPGRELRVELDLRRMAELGITPAALQQAIRSGNSNIPAGTLDLGPRSFTLKTSGSYASLDQVRDTVVASREGTVTRVSDVASVFWSDRPLSYVGRFKGERAVFVTANQKDGFNILKVRQGIAATAAEFGTELPGRVRLEWGFDQSRNVERRLDRLAIDLAIAIALVSITLLPLGLRAAGIVMVTIPLALSFGLACIYFLGFSLNQLSIAGFVLALGLLVDDAIVVVENISRHLRLGYSRVDAAVRGTQQILTAILGCTAALVFAFLPLMVLPETAGKFIRVLPLTVVSTIIGSLLIALFIIPFIASRVLQPDAAEGNRSLRRMMALIERWYRPALEYCLARPRFTAAAAIGASLLLTAALVPVVGSSLFPKSNAPAFLVKIETPNGSSLAATEQALRFAEARVAAMPEVQSWFSNLGHGNPQIYYNQVPREDAPNYAEMFVQLRTYSTRGTPRRLDDLRRELSAFPNARIFVDEFVNGPPISAPIAVRVVGPDLDTLERLSRDVEEMIRAVPGTQEVDNPLRVPRTNLRLRVDPQKASQLGVPIATFDEAVRLSVSGLEVGRYKETDGEQYPIVVRSPVAARADYAALGEVRVTGAGGRSLPLSQLARLEFEKAPTQIQRYDRERSVTINAKVQRDLNTAKVTAEVVRRLDAFEFPRGYRYVLGGEAQSGSESFAGVGTAAIVAVFGIFAVLVLEFGSFRSTLIVLTVVPIGVVGGYLALLLTGNSLSFTASIGLIALIGIEIKNSILLVDFTNQLRAQGVGLDEAIERAGETRFVPILLTSATAIGGLLPLALQNVGLYSPMAWVIIGGLVTSTILARLVTPVMYKLFTPDVEVRSAPFS